MENGVFERIYDSINYSLNNLYVNNDNKKMSNNKKSMKKLLIATLLIGMVSSCEEPTTTTKSTQHTVKIGVDVKELKVVEIEGCEYFLGTFDRSAMFTHKGNCKNPIHKGGNNEQQ